MSFGKRLLRNATALLTLCTLSPTLSGCSGKEPERVLLISVDGLRADAIENTEYGKYLIENYHHTLEVTTVDPSVTLPCHMSMFHSVPPTEHGVMDNNYTPNEALGNGICEALLEKGKTSAIFYNWNQIGTIATEDSVQTSRFINGETEGWEESNKLLADAATEHILNTPTDFVFLYLGFLDDSGHRCGWLSDEYYYALNESLALVKAVSDAATKNGYTVILTSDHGGHGFAHGSTLPEDMTVPLFIIGDKFAGSKNLGPSSILDVAPTVLDLFGISAPDYWQGKIIE